ncbi:MAG: hypothetical protein AAFN11_14305, partial [Chloroflexota bacterium]
EIKVKGHLSPRWASQFDGLTIQPDPEANVTMLFGPVRDQAALHGLLERVRNLGLELVSVNPLPDATQHTENETERESKKENRYE